jgi:hypothetical protein
MKTIYLTLDSPAVYVIRVAGILDEKWSDYLGGLAITTADPGQGKVKPITILEGELIDQAALLGVLNALYDYHYPLISVECRNVGQLDREAGRGL